MLVAAISMREGVAPAAAPPDAVQSYLERELEARVGAVVEWEQARRSAIEAMADDDSLRGQLRAVTGGRAAALDLLLGGLCVDLQGCTVARPDGTVLASYSGRYAPEPLVRAAARGRTVQSQLVATDSLGRIRPSAAEARYAVFFATPIVEDGEVRAVLTGRVSPDQELGAILGRRPPGRTGETYAVDPRGYMVTRSRFDAQGRHPAEAPRVLGEPATWLHTPRGKPTRPLAALHSAGTDVDGYIDYRGVRVVGAWRWIDELGAGVITEMDASEAFRITALR